MLKALPKYPAAWSEAGRALVRVSDAVATARGWRVGDRLSIPVPQVGEIYDPLIERIDEGPDRARAAVGRIVGDDGESRRFVVTVGPGGVFAYVETPEGPYELAAGMELGWLVPTASMMAGVDFGERDYLLPGEAIVGRPLGQSGVGLEGDPR